MLQQSSTYSAKILREFKNLDQYNFHAVVHFYEEHEREISRMSVEEHFVLLASYVNALHEIGAFRKVLVCADHLLQYSIMHDIQFHRGEDIYLKTLFQKATAQFHTHDYPAAQHSLGQLVKIQPNYKPYRKYLRKSLLRQRPLYVKRLFAFGVILYLFSVVMVVINILLIQPYFPDWQSFSEYLRIGIFALSIIFLVSGEISHYYKAHQKVRALRNRAQMKKRSL